MALLSKQDLRTLFDQLTTEYEYLSNNRMKLEADCKKLQEYIEDQITQIKTINDDFEKLRQEYIQRGQSSAKSFNEISSSFRGLGNTPMNDQNSTYMQQNQSFQQQQLLQQQGNSNGISNSSGQISTQNQEIRSQYGNGQYINEQPPLQDQQLQEEQTEQDWELIPLVSADQISNPVLISLFAEIVDTSVICSTAFSPDGTCLAIGSDQTLRVYNIEKDSFLMQKTIEESNGESSNNHVRTIAWTSDGKTIICGSEDSKIRSFDLDLTTKDENDAGKLTHCFPTGNGDVFQLQISKDDSFLAAATSDGCLTIYSMNSTEENNNDNELAKYKVLSVLTREIDPSKTVAATSLSISDDGKLIAVGYTDSYVAIWDIETNSIICEQECHTRDVYAVKFIPNGRLVTASLDSTIKIWDLVIEEKVIQNEVPSKSEPKVENASEEKETENKKENEKETENTEQKEDENKNDEAENDINDEEKETSSTIQKVGTLKLWREVKGHTDFVLSLAVDPSGTWLLSGSKDLTARLTNLNAGVMMYCIKGHKDSIITVSFSPSGKMFCTGSGDNAVKMWSINPEEDADA